MIKKIYLSILVPVFLLSSMPCVRAQGVHDVAVTNVTLVLPYGAYAVYGGKWSRWWVDIFVMVKNDGEFSETFNVTIYYNYSAIETKTVTDLAAGGNTTLAFKWAVKGAWPYRTYTIKAEASVVAGETDLIDNILTDGTVRVRWPGDANDDGFVNAADAGIICFYWFGIYRWPGYNWRADFDGSGRIDAADFAILGYMWFSAAI